MKMLTYLNISQTPLKYICQLSIIVLHCGISRIYVQSSHTEVKMSLSHTNLSNKT